MEKDEVNSTISRLQLLVKKKENKGRKENNTELQCYGGFFSQMHENKFKGNHLHTVS